MVAEGRAPWSHSGARERFAQCGTRCINVAENLARADDYSRDDLPSATVREWCGSEGHRRNLLGPFDACGIGWAASDNGTIFVTQLLALLDEQSSRRGHWYEVASGIASSTPAVCAAVGLASTGPVVAVAGGLVGGALERVYGLQLVSAPRMLRDRAAMWLRPPACSRCGCAADVGDLFVTSADRGEASKLLCGSCHPSPADADVWFFVA